MRIKAALYNADHLEYGLVTIPFPIPQDQYRYPEESGSFTGTLTFRCWHRSKPMLLCFFDADDGRKIKLSVWWQSWGVNYSPSKTLINFADEVFDGSRWHCTYRKKSNGYIRWEQAEQLD